MSRIRVAETLAIDVPAEAVIEYLRDMNHLAVYEPKVRTFRIERQSGECGVYAAGGWFAFLPWAGTFEYKLRKDGFDSQMIRGPRWMKVDGGFRVRPAGQDRCNVTHWEAYETAFPTFPFSSLIKVYLHASIRRELRNIHAQVVRLAVARPASVWPVR